VEYGLTSPIITGPVKPVRMRLNAKTVYLFVFSVAVAIVIVINIKYYFLVIWRGMTFQDTSVTLSVAQRQFQTSK
jgi:hypothetical protein